MEGEECWCRNVCICRWQSSRGLCCWIYRGRSSHSADRFFSVPEPSWNPYFPIFKHLIILKKLSSFLLSRPIFRNSHLLKLSSAMMIWAADHLMVDQRVRELLSTLIEEWGVNTFQRGVNFRALDQAYPESGLDKCAPPLFTPVISRLPAHRQISYHVSCSVIIGGPAREIARRWLPAGASYHTTRKCTVLSRT